MDEDIIKDLETQLVSLQEKINSIKNDKKIIPDEITCKNIKETISAKNLNVKLQSDGSLGYNLEVEIKAAKSKSGTRTRDSYAPTEDQLTIINSTCLEDQTSESGYVFTFQATNSKNGVDRSLESLSNKALNKLAERAIKNKIPYLVASKADCEDHTWKAINSYGYVFNAYVKDGALFYDVFMGKVARNEEILDAMFTAAINKLSIGFSMSEMDFQCNSCKKPIASDQCKHQPGEMDEKGNLVTMTITDVAENYEISGVAVPCQQDANITRQTGKSLVDTKSFTYNGNQISKNLEDVVNGFSYIYDNEIFVKGGLLQTLDSVVEADSDKIINGKNTIEDNILMDDDKKIVTLDENDKLCKTAERVKSEAVAEIKEIVKAELAVLDSVKEEVLAAVKSLDEKLSVFTAIKSLEDKVDAKSEETIEAKLAEITAKMARMELLLEVNRTVPGSKTLVDMTNTSAKDATAASTDVLLNAVK